MSDTYKYSLISYDPITLEGPHSIVISAHEFYKPTTESFFERHHNATN